MLLSSSVNDITQIINSVGFPIFSWLVMAWYLYKRGEADDKKNKEMSDKLENLNNSCLSTIKQNTEVLQELCTIIKERS
nr:MAG TPA: YvrJ protein family protein [Caudoviricetes sp.]